MKTLLKFLLTIVSMSAVLFSCNEPVKEEVKDLTLTADKTTITADGADEVAFTVKYGDETVTAAAKIFYNGGVEVTGGKFSANEAGTYRFHAEYDNEKSREITITATEAETPVGKTLTISADKTEIYADGIDTVTFSVTYDGDDVTSVSEIRVKGADPLASNGFTSTEPGEYELYAAYQDGDELVESENSIIITVIEVPELTLSVNKYSIVGDGADKVIFTVLFDGDDVTADAKIYTGSQELGSKSFSGTTPGEYEFHAAYTKNGKEFLCAENMYVTVISTNDIAFSTSGRLRKTVSYFAFTATWCNPCYTFKNNMKIAIQNVGKENITQVNFYTGTGFDPSEPEVASDLTYTLARELWTEGRFYFTGIPAPICEFRWLLDNTLQAINSSYNNSTGNPARTGIMVNSAVGTETVDVTVTVGAQQADTYYIGVILVEDDIVCYQNGGGLKYNHTNVFRDIAAASIFGEEIGAMGVGDTIEKKFSFDVSPDYDKDNLSIIVYTLYEDDGDRVTANTIKATAKGVTPYKYL